MAGRKRKQAKSKKNIGRFTAGDYGLPESEVSIDWNALGSDDDNEGVVETTTVKEEQATTSSSPTRTFTKRRSARNRSIRFNEPTVGLQSGQQESPPVGGMTAPFQPSTTHTGESSLEPVNLESIHRGQQRLQAEQARLAKDLERISADLRDAKKKHNSIDKMVKKILSKMGCSSSMDTDSD